MKKIIYASMLLCTLCLSLVLVGCNNKSNDDIDEIDIDIDIDAELEAMDRGVPNPTLDDLSDITKGMYLYFISENTCKNYNNGAAILSGDESKAEEEKAAFIYHLYYYQNLVSEFVSEDDEAFETLILSFAKYGTVNNGMKTIARYMVIQSYNKSYYEEFHRLVKGNGYCKECKKILEEIKEGYMN
ncbi:MAG: hypothetical protein MJ245_04250 [Clostridia bacterium]|nr:hypothetical protein [Clostridia bacterium]